MDLWNWKAALLSALYRAPIFFFAGLRAGWRQAFSAMVVDTVFRGVTSGFYGALIQAIRKLEPVWLSILIILVLAPAAVQILEFAVHWFRHTPNLKTSIFVSSLLTAVASLFNWYAMRRGTLLTGKEGTSFGTDLKRLPGLIAGFVLSGPIALLRNPRKTGAPV